MGCDFSDYSYFIFKPKTFGQKLEEEEFKLGLTSLTIEQIVSALFYYSQKEFIST